MKQYKDILSIFLRYILILLVGLRNLFIFYKIFTPLTVKSVSFILGLFFQTYSVSSTIIFDSIQIILIPACIAGAAYYLLFIIILSTPNIKILNRIYILFFSFLAFFILNVTRIIFLAIINKSLYFDSVHEILWYFLSTIFVVLIWLLAIKIFKIKSIPIYSDIKYLFKLIKLKTKR